MRCMRCDHPNSADALFCSSCGESLASVNCSACGRSNPAGSRFCNGCGIELKAATEDLRRTAPRSYTPAYLAERILTSRAALEGERKLVTVLFCDIADSTDLAERIGPDEMHTLLNRFFGLALGVIHRYEGTINQFLGDGFMALFGAPLTHEDHARRAALAALALQRIGAAQFEQLREGGHAFELRMGLNTGLVVVGGIGDNLRMDYTAVGDTTNVAARLEQAAAPGTILVSDATARLVTGYVRTDVVGPLAVKGKNEPVLAHRVVGIGLRRSPLDSVAARRLTPFAGRAAEFAQLRDALAKTEAGQGQAIAVVGEAGMGKSRLIYEFRQSLEAGQVTYLEGRCLSYGRAVPYLPILELLRNNARIAEADSEEVIAEKTATALRELGMDVAECAPYLLHLFGVKRGTEQLEALTPEAIKARTFETIRRMALVGSSRRPIIFSVEDLHWVDSTSEECLAQLAGAIPGARIMVLCTYRPDYAPRWIKSPYASQIGLSPLSSTASLEVVQSVFEADPGEDIAQLILGRAEGNPFFLEEIAKTVREQANRTSSIVVPDTVQGVLMARIDRLPEEMRKVLQTASILGREFSLKMLRAIWSGPSVPEPHLLDLKRQDFLYERADAEEPAYVFKHALTQDVVYESLLESRRRALHAAAGRSLEAFHHERLDDAVDRLAYHYSKAGDAPKAISYLVRSADKAARVYANSDAVKALQDALGMVGELPIDERDRAVLVVLLRLAHSLYFSARNADCRDVLLKHREQAERLADAQISGAYYFWLGHAHTYLGNQEEARVCAKRSIEEAERAGDPIVTGKAFYVLARAAFWSAQFRQGREEALGAVTLLENTVERWWLAQSNWIVAANLYLMGEFDSALDALRRCDSIGERIGDPRLRTYAAWTSGAIYGTSGEWEKAIAACELGLSRSPDPMNTAAATGYMGAALIEKGSFADALSPLSRSVEQLTRFKFLPLLAWFQSYLADAQRLTGDLEGARSVSTQAIEAGTLAKFEFGVAMATRARGRVAQAAGRFAEAEADYLSAAQKFESMGARFEFGRTHYDLALLRSAEGRRDDAARELAEALSHFTELRVPRYVARVREVALHNGVGLADAALRDAAGKRA